MNRRIFLPVAGSILALATVRAAAARAEAPPAEQAPNLISERIYNAARPRLLQVRTLLASADQKSEIGSAFLVSADGLAITNYHVVSQYALELTRTWVSSTPKLPSIQPVQLAA
jgi:S1-C subfamily serine protease